MRNRHFYEAEDIASEFQQAARNESSVRLDYPLRFFSSLPKENLTEADFEQLAKEVCIPRYEEPQRRLRKTNWERASWPRKPMAGHDASLRDIHAQLCAEFYR